MLDRYMSAPEAIAFIRLKRDEGRAVLGVDGFEIVDQGFIARLDLVLDLSEEGLSPDQAYVTAVDFIQAQEASNIVFEVVAD